MATVVGMTKPYRAFNGHLMVAPLIVGKHAGPDAEGRPMSAWAECVPDCDACADGYDLPDW